MGIMDNVSAFTKGVGQKAKGNYDILALNNQISGLNKEKDVLVKELGQKYYSLHREDPEDDLVEIVKSIIDKEDRIEELNREIEDKKEEVSAVSLSYDGGGDVNSKPVQVMPGGPKCPKCGAPINIGDTFCAGCGNKIEIPVAANTGIEAGGRRCPNCNSVVQDDELFCSNCGTKIES